MARGLHVRFEDGLLAHALVARRLAGTGEGKALGLVCGLFLVALFGAQLLTPPDVLLSALALLPVMVAAWCLSTGWSISIGFLAIASRFFSTLFEGRNSVTGVIEMSTLVALFIAMRVIGRDRAGEQRMAAVTPALKARAVRLTRRERDVVKLALEGLTAREIGRHLFIGQRTVESHLAHAYRKLGVTSKLELVRRPPDLD